MAWLKRPKVQSFDLAPLLVNTTAGAATATKVSGLVTLNLLSVAPTAAYTGGTFLTLPSELRPAGRLDFFFAANLTSTLYRSGYILPGGQIGVWAPSTDDKYRLLITYPARE
ncbi:hypothetical protein [Gulosibacter sediminis]|uniref:hypothetical protein n=1 Tax=Gulosibacter sediminis TaxID=1729695 RepID=UPI0024A9143F|nr:hypothetical protein [Gulosibacter sediminis]